MKFYQAAIIRVDGRYVLTHVSEVGNPLRIRVDRFRDGPSVLRMLVAPADSMRAWEHVNPRELLERYNEHCRQERARIAVLLSPPTRRKKPHA